MMASDGPAPLRALWGGPSMSDDGLGLRQIVAIFDRCFADERTVLIGGAEEPLYQPWDGDRPARIHFRADYLASALHEVAHWCIAGLRRRRLVDFGYWYAPDGRDTAGQAAFERVEARPQAIEWHFHLACGSSFHPSADNLSGDAGDLAAFVRSVVAAAIDYRSRGLPPRARRFARALATAHPPGAAALAAFQPDLATLI